MDPITAIQTVSSLTSLIKTCRTVIEAIQEFRHGDDNLAELMLDVETFVEFLQGLERVLGNERTKHQISHPVLQKALKDAGSTVEKLKPRLERIKGTESLVPRRLKWLKFQAEFQKLRGRIKYHNITLYGFLTIAQVDTYLFECNQQPQLLRLSTDAQDDMEGKAGLIIDLPTEDEKGSFVARIDSSSDSLAVETVVDLASTTRIEPKVGPRKPPTTEVCRESCTYTCYCICHEDDDEASTVILERKSKVIGRVSRTRRPCSVPSCQGAAIPPSHEKKLVLPSSLFQQALVSLMMIRSVTVKYYLHTYRMVPEWSASMRYVKYGNLHKLKACIEDGSATPFDTAPDGWSLLHTAAYHSHLAIVQYLLKLGADTEVGEVGTRKPADLAILRALSIDSTKIHKEIMGAFPKISSYMIDYAFSPIHIAVLGLYEPGDSTRPSLQELIDFIDDANNASPGNDWATWRLDDVNSSPLYSQVVDMFRSAATELPKGEKPIIDIIDQGDEKWGWPPFHWAAFTGRREQMEILISNNANPFKLTPSLNGRNVLHKAAESKRSDVLSFVLDIWENDKDKLDINQADRWMETPLHLAAMHSAKCVKLLLAKGADPNARQENGHVALHYASICPEQDEKWAILNHLVSHGGTKVDARDEDGMTPVFEFLNSPECIQLLVNYGADLSVSDNRRSSAVHYACIEDKVEALEKILELSTDPGAATRLNDIGNNPLLEAFSHRSRDCVRYLLDRPDSGFGVAGRDGWSAIHYAAKWGDADILKAVLTHPQFERGQKTADGKTAQRIAKEACWFGEVAELLQRYDSLAGRDGWSAIHYATKWGDADILEAILTHPQFERGQKTADGKTAEGIAKEACTWTGKVKELLKRHDSLAGNFARSKEV